MGVARRMASGVCWYNGLLISFWRSKIDRLARSEFGFEYSGIQDVQ